MALSQYYGIVQLKQSEFEEYKYRKQKYLLELDKETVMNSGKQKIVEKYQQFYITKQDILYKGILKSACKSRSCLIYSLSTMSS